MRFNKLGSSDMEVSNVCLGTMTFGRTRDGQDSGGLKRERCESREFTVEVVWVFSLAFFFLSRNE